MFQLGSADMLTLDGQISKQSFAILLAEEQAQASVRGRRGIKSVRAAAVLADPVNDPVALLSVVQRQRECPACMSADVDRIAHSITPSLRKSMSSSRSAFGRRTAFTSAPGKDSLIASTSPLR